MRYRFLDFELDTARFALSRSGEARTLPPKVFRVLERLVASPQRVVTKAELLDAAWSGVHVTENSLNQCVRQVRELLSAHPGGAGAIEAVYGRGYRFTAPVEVVRDGPGTPGLDDAFWQRPSVAVLPFDAPDGGQPALGRGIGEDLAHRIAAYRWFPVVAHATVQSWLGHGGRIESAAAEIGARYVVRGTLRGDGGRFRVDAELIEAGSGRLVAAERYETRFHEMFAFQEEVASGLAASLEPELRRAEMSRALRRDPETLDAWDELLRGLFHLWQYTRAANREARSWLERAARSDPGFAAPLTFLGLSHLNDVNAGWSEDPRRSSALAVQLATRAVALDPRDPHGPALLGGMLALFGRKDEALTLLGGALESNPSFAWGHWALGRGLSLWGRPDEAIAHLAAARRLSPRDPLVAHFHEGLAFAHFARGDVEGALDSARESVRLRPDWPRVHHVLCASASAAGEHEAALRARAEALALGERRTLADLRRGFERAAAERDFVERYIQALAAAGWE